MRTEMVQFLVNFKDACSKEAKTYPEKNFGKKFKKKNV